MESLKIQINGRRIGESIICQWKDDNNQLCTGIIDCGLGIDRSNETLSFIRSNRISRIEFVILTHPHFDRFSGMNQLFEYCFGNNIQINSFIHTMNVNPKYIFSEKSIDNRRSINSIDSYKNAFVKVLKKIIDLNKSENKIIGKIEIGIDNFRVPMNNNLHLKFKAPSYYELSEYQEMFNKLGRADANLLSGLILIRTKDSQIVISSDVTMKTLERLSSDKDFNSKKTLLTTLPHKGSKQSHLIKFWDNVLDKDNNTKIVTVGNSRYKHPNKEVLQYFKDKAHITVLSDSPKYQVFDFKELNKFENSDKVIMELKTNEQNEEEIIFKME